MVKMYEAFLGRKTEKDLDEDDEGFNQDGNNIDIFHEERGEEVMSTMLDGSKQTLDTGCLPNQSSGFMQNQSSDFMPNQSSGFMPNKSTSFMLNQASAFKDTEDEEEELLYASTGDEQYQRVMAY